MNERTAEKWKQIVEKHSQTQLKSINFCRVNSLFYAMFLRHGKNQHQTNQNESVQFHSLTVIVQ